MTLSKYMPSEVTLEDGDEIIYGIEISNEAKQIQELNDDIHEITMIGLSLENLHSDLNEVGTLEGDAKKYAQIAFESHLEQLGVDGKKMSFESDITDAIASIWKAIINAIKKAFRAIGNFLKRIFRFLTGQKREIEKERKRTEECEVTPKENLEDTLADVTEKNIKKSKSLGERLNDATLKGYFYLTEKQRMTFEGLTSEIEVADEVLDSFSGSDFLPIKKTKIKNKNPIYDVTKVVKSCFTYGDFPLSNENKEKTKVTKVTDFFKSISDTFAIARGSTLAKQTGVKKATMVETSNIIDVGKELEKRITEFGDVSALVDTMIYHLDKDVHKSLDAYAKLMEKLHGGDPLLSSIPMGDSVSNATRNAIGTKYNYTHEKISVPTEGVYATKIPDRKQLDGLSDMGIKIASTNDRMKLYAKDYQKHVERLNNVVIMDDHSVHNDILLSIPKTVHAALHLVYNEYLFSLAKAASQYSDGMKNLVKTINDLYGS